MKKVLLTLLILASVMKSFSQSELKRFKQPKQDERDKRVYNVTKNNGGLTLYQFSTWLKYSSYNDEVIQLDKDKNLNMWTDEQYAENKAKVAAGGLLFFTTRRQSLETSNAGNITVIIQDGSGKEIDRIKIDDKYGTYSPSTQYSPLCYYNTFGVSVKQSFPELKIFVVDQMANVRYEYIVKCNE